MQARLRAPFGHILIHETDGSVGAVHLDSRIAATSVPPRFPRRALDPFRAYFAGEVVRPDVPVIEQGTTFERAVWHELVRVEPGRPITYGEMARRVGRPLAARAVGQALRKNPIPLVWPCHRVVASDGIGGFGGWAGDRDDGAHHVAIKRWLLEHEARLAGVPMQRTLATA